MTASITTGGAPIIVCGTDFTASAHDAVDVARSLAAAMDGRLELVHVVDVPRHAWRDETSQARAIDQATAALADEIARLAGPPAVAVTARVAVGAPATRLAEVAVELDAALLVVAAAGPTRSILTVGGTAGRLAQIARMPVLLVRDPAPVRAWLRGGRLHVAALVSDDAASEHVIDWLRLLRRLGTADVALLQAYYPDEAARRLGLTPRPLVVADRRIEDHIDRDLRHRVGELPGSGRLAVHPVLAIGRQADHLIGHPATLSAGLVIVGNHRARGVARLSSVAAGVLHLARRSVLIVPADAPVLTEAPWPRFRRVLAATDLSSSTTDVIRHACGLVAGSDGEVVLLHVLGSSTDDATRAETCAALERLLPAHPPAGVTTRVEAATDTDAAEGILHAAARLGADCIVVASHGRSGWRKVLVGSVAQRVAQLGDRPVLIVRPPDDGWTRAPP